MKEEKEKENTQKQPKEMESNERADTPVVGEEQTRMMKQLTAQNLLAFFFNMITIELKQSNQLQQLLT